MFIAPVTDLKIAIYNSTRAFYNPAAFHWTDPRSWSGFFDIVANHNPCLIFNHDNSLFEMWLGIEMERERRGEREREREEKNFAMLRKN